MNLRIDFFEAMSSIKRWEDKILGKFPFKTILTIFVIVVVWQLVMDKSTLSSMKSNIYSIRRGISTGSVVSEVQEQISSIKSDVSSLESSISLLRSDVSLIKSDISLTKLQTSSIESDVSQMKRQISSVELNMFSYARKSRVSDVESRLDSVESDVSSIKRKMGIIW